MAIHDQVVFDALLRRDLASFIAKSFAHLVPGEQFIAGWHINALAWELEQCRLGNSPRLVVTMPPRSLKSLAASVALPAFVLGHDPTRHIVCISHEAQIAGKFARDCRSIMMSSWYRRAFPTTRLSRERNSAREFMTTRRGTRLAASVGGSASGHGGSLIIVDDPMPSGHASSAARRAAVCDWFDRTIQSRLNDKSRDTIIVVARRLHPEDLVGHLQASYDGWKAFSLPATAEHDQLFCLGEPWHYRKTGDVLHPEREPPQLLAAIAASLGPAVYAAHYQQAPISGGALLQPDWFRSHDQSCRRDAGDRIIQSWDIPAMSSEFRDYSVCTTWRVAASTYDLLDLYREKLSYPALKRAIVAQAQRYVPNTVLVNDGKWGRALSREFPRRGDGRETPVSLQLVDAVDDSVTRASIESAALEARLVALPPIAPWRPAFDAELAQFPQSSRAAQIDSMTTFLYWLRVASKYRSGSFGG